jgi:hypothetical protein
MSFKLEFETDNDAFQDGNLTAEVVRILTVVATQVLRSDIRNLDPDLDGTETVSVTQSVRDINGNKIGTWQLDVSGDDD